MRVAEVGYAAGVGVRNLLYARGVLGMRRVGVPVVSVGNITTGGTGKTPVVRWLVEQLRGVGYRPGVLMRGYKRAAGGVSDEQAMLEEMLEGGVVHAEADRVAGAKQVLAEHPEVDVLVLDDGFQHRRMGREFDLVLVDGREPFGYRHVLPRGLLREPMRGLGRADAFVITHSDEIGEGEQRAIEEELRSHNAAAPVYRARHVQTGLRAGEQRLEMGKLGGRRFYAAAGIGRPEGLERKLAQFGAGYCGHRWFEDHHDYGAEDLAAIRREAKAAGADVVVVTEKDWAKIRRLAGAGDDGMPIWRLEMRIAFEGQGESGLLEFIRTTIEKKRADERAEQRC